MVFNVWTSSFVQGNRGFLFFTIGRFISESLDGVAHFAPCIFFSRTPGPPFGALTSLRNANTNDERLV
jgi:hypothetical protein